MKNNCEYCNEESRKPFILNDDVSVFINDKDELMIINHYSHKAENKKINYCPMCGRKLKKEQENETTN